VALRHPLIEPDTPCRFNGHTRPPPEADFDHTASLRGLRPERMARSWSRWAWGWAWADGKPSLAVRVGGVEHGSVLRVMRRHATAHRHAEFGCHIRHTRHCGHREETRPGSHTRGEDPPWADGARYPSSGL
jgi:hypothetical protein